MDIAFPLLGSVVRTFSRENIIIYEIPVLMNVISDSTNVISDLKCYALNYCIDPDHSFTLS
jgi:hypothetical protein